jgi:hypothetical protein
MKCLLRREARVESSSGEDVSWKVGMPLEELVGALLKYGIARVRSIHLPRWRRGAVENARVEAERRSAWAARCRRMEQRVQTEFMVWYMLVVY